MITIYNIKDEIEYYRKLVYPHYGFSDEQMIKELPRLIRIDNLNHILKKHGARESKILIKLGD